MKIRIIHGFVGGGEDTENTITGNTKIRINEIYYENRSAKIKSRNQNANILLFKNIDRDKVIQNLRKTKVYFHALSETFGKYQIRIIKVIINSDSNSPKYYKLPCRVIFTLTGRKIGVA